jgi:hypothetical protein
MILTGVPAPGGFTTILAAIAGALASGIATRSRTVGATRADAFTSDADLDPPPSSGVVDPLDGAVADDAAVTTESREARHGR